MKKLVEILEGIDVVNSNYNKDEYLHKQINLITSNSKDASANSIFVAIVGNAKNGLDFLDSAINNGAIVCVIDTLLNELNVIKNYPNVVFLQVDNARLALAKMLANYYGEQLPKNLLTITGTNGKSSIAMLTSQFLTLLNKKNMAIGTLGIFHNGTKIAECLTTPTPELLNISLHNAYLDNIDYAIMESSSHGIHQSRIAGLSFKAIGWTNLTQDHLDYHKNMEEYYLSKQKLFLDNPKSVAVINVDDSYGKRLANECNNANIKVIAYGKNVDYGAFNCKIEEIVKHNNYQEVKILFNNLSYVFKINLMGEFQVYNVLCTMLLLVNCGISLLDILNVSENLVEIEGRLNLVMAKNNAKIFIDFAHTPNALEEVLKVLKKDNPKKLKVLFGCGGNRDSAKRSIMGGIATEYADKIYVSDDNPRFEDPKFIRSQIIEGIKNKNYTNFVEIDNREVAIKQALKELEPEEILLIAGKGHESYQIIGDVANHFNDKEMVVKYLGS
jgi:UDP-N-acetylmuramoyl-L-alanyl-D-glutamate--2,6-diaminopimelate ligase